jgi:membrane-bound lytic murein transglycosylase D
MRLRRVRHIALLGALLVPLLAAAPAVAASGGSKSSQSASKAKKPKRKARKARRSRKKPKPRLKGSKPGAPDQSVRNQLTGQHPDRSTATPVESAELKAMREADRELFPPATAPAAAPWSTSLTLIDGRPRVDASGLPAGPSLSPTQPAKPPKRDLSWLAKLTKPDFPVRFEPAVVKYLEYYRNTPRGRRLVAAFVRKAGRYRGAISKLLKQYKLPQDLIWLASVESAFNPQIHSHAGAAGLWQFMPATGRVYGLTVNRRVDERLDPERSTHAALRHLKDLHQRFGSWELAFAAYNMGYGGLLASIRKYNTNDYWELRRHEAGLPYETALYVPKIMAMAIASRNCKAFGCDQTPADDARPFGDDGVDKVSVAPGVTLEDVADASGEKLELIAKLNPQVIGNRMPPVEQSATKRRSWPIYVPEGKGKKAQAKLPRTGAVHRYGTHQVRWGEPLSHIAAAYGTSERKLQRINDLRSHESPRPGTTIFVPRGLEAKSAGEIAAASDTIRAVVPNHTFDYRERRRVFYAPVLGDTVEDVARVCGVTASEVRRWNHLDAHAALQKGMRLQLFLPKTARPDNVVLLEDAFVETMTVGTEPFHEHFVGSRGRKRVQVTVAEGDTWKKLGKRYGLSLGMLERINHKSRRSRLSAGDQVVIYARPGLLPPPKSANDSPAAPTPERGTEPAIVPKQPADETGGQGPTKTGRATPSVGPSPKKAASPAR